MILVQNNAGKTYIFIFIYIPEYAPLKPNKGKDISLNRILLKPNKGKDISLNGIPFKP